MPAYTVIEKPEREGSIFFDWNRDFSRVFQVEFERTSYPSIDSIGPKACYAAVRNVFGVYPGVSYYVSDDESDAFSRCKQMNAKTMSRDGWSYLVTATFGQIDPTLANQDPTDNEPEVTWSFAQYEEVCDEDIHGNPIGNAAGDPFDDPPEVRDQSRPVLNITRNEYTFSPLIASLYNDHTNESDFWGWPTGTVKCSNISAVRSYSAEIGRYYKVSYEFHFNIDGWKKKPLNRGLRQIVAGALKCCIVQFSPAQSPCLLDHDGLQLPPNGDPVYLEFEVYHPAEFNSLGFVEPNP